MGIHPFGKLLEEYTPERMRAISLLAEVLAGMRGEFVGVADLSIEPVSGSAQFIATAVVSKPDGERFILSISPMAR